MAETILETKNLSIAYVTKDFGTCRAINDVSFSLKKGHTLGLVGETGAGKTTIAKGILRLLPVPQGRVTDGTVIFEGEDLYRKSERAMRSIRGRKISMIFQDPMTSLNPIDTVGDQIAEVIRLHSSISRKEAFRRAVESLEMVGIPSERAGEYPHQFSGGMKQRVMIAIAIACNPELLIADEPTTALDVTIQAQILDLLRDIQKKLGTATIFVTHDLGAVARVADRVAVMYAGKIVEIGTAEEIFYDPRHPYTWGLLKALPALTEGRDTLETLPGMPPVLCDLPKGDAFACRNPYALDIDYEEEPPMFAVTDTHYAATWLLDPRAPRITPPIGGRGDGR